MMVGSAQSGAATRPVSRAVMIGVLVVVSLLYLTATMHRSIILYDEGLILFGAERVRNGEIPHRDFYANYGPAQFYLLAGLYKLFGASVLIARVLDSVERCVCVVMVFIIVDGAAPRLHAILAATASLIWLQYYGAYGYPIFPALAAALAGLACLMSAARGKKPIASLIAAGAAAGMITLFRYEIGIAAFGTECLLLALMPLVDRSAARSLRNGLASGGAADADRWRLLPGPDTWGVIGWRLLTFSLGFAIVTVPVALAFAWYGVIPDLVFDIGTTVRNYARMRSMPFPRVGALWANPSELGVYLPFIVFCSAVPTIVRYAAVPRMDFASGHHIHGENPARLDRDVKVVMTPVRWTLLALMVMTLLFCAKGAVHVSALFMSMGLITSLALAGILARFIRGRSRLNASGIATALAITSTVTVYNVPPALHEAWWNFDWARDGAAWTVPVTGVPPALGTCRMPAGLERVACFKIRADIAQTVLYIQHRTAIDEPVFVGLTRHDMMLGNDNLIYFLLERPSATKWHHYDPGLQTTAPIQRLMIKELESVKPRLIVLEDWGKLTDPNESSVSSGVTLLDDYILDTYEPVATFGTNTILQLKIS